jgi:hypothetical protein
MISSFSEMNPYYTMASAAVNNATDYINATAQDFFMNQWPIMVNRMDILWARWQNDPQAWIAMYPATLFALALIIWVTNPGGGRIKRDYEDDDAVQEVNKEELDDDYNDNIMTRKRRVILVTPPKKRTDHPMIRRSQATRMFVFFE